MSTRPNRRPFVFGVLLAKAAGATLCLTAAAGNVAAGDNPVILQWFECKWTDMEKRVPDWFMAGYGAVWVPPISRCLDSGSAGYNPFDRFDLGSPSAPTAYGTADYFDAARGELQRADGQVYIDAIYNHNGARDASTSFQANGGWPGFWLNSAPGNPTKQPTDNWGDFHNGNASGYLQSENPSGSNYNLSNGDLVSLIDIAQESNNAFIRHPVAAGDPQNIPAGTLYNKPDPKNAQFYSNRSLTGTAVSNPGTFRYSGTLNFTFYPYDGLNGTAVADNGTGLLMRWTQWIMDVHKVDGFRLDAIKHVPSWFWDQYFDSIVYNRRTTPDGRKVIPFSFGESVESNQFCYDNYIRKPNNNNRAGDSWGNRDCLDLNGAGQLRDLINASGNGSWQNVINAHLDNQDGNNDGTLGVNHIWSHDNGDGGDGGSAPPYPSATAQGMYAHAYLLTRPGVANVYHNARGITRTSGFWPRQGMPTALGFNTDPAVNAPDGTLTKLVQIHNWVARNDINLINSTDPQNQSNADVLIYERRKFLGFGSYTATCVVACNDRYDAGTDARWVKTSFPTGTRLIELTGNAADATVDPTNAIPEVLTTADYNGTPGWVLITTPRNKTGTTTHNKGYLIYAPSLPSGTLNLTGITSTIAADTNFVPSYRRRMTPIPVITGNSFQIQLTTSNGDTGIVGQPGANDNTDDNALFKIDQGYKDFNGNGVVDFDYTNAVAAGYEQFLTLKDPLYNKGYLINQGNYAQTIDASLLDEGVHYLSVVAFRHRGASDSPLFREFRQVFYVDRLPPIANITNFSPVISANPSKNYLVKAGDRTVTRTHVIMNLASAADPIANSNSFNQCTQNDRFDYSRAVSFVNGVNRVTLVTFELSGRSAVTDYYVNYFTTCPGDFNADGFVDDSDFVVFASAYDALIDLRGDLNGDGQTDDSDFVIFAQAYNDLLCP